MQLSDLTNYQQSDVNIAQSVDCAYSMYYW